MNLAQNVTEKQSEWDRYQRENEETVDRVPHHVPQPAPSPSLRERLTKLAAAGYGPLLLALIPPGEQYPRWNKGKRQYEPAIASGKSPGIWNGRTWADLTGWTARRATEADIEKIKDWPEDTGIGLQTGTVVAFDVDVKVPPSSTEPHAVKARALISDIRNIVATKLGLSADQMPARMRSNSTSVMFFARIDVPLKKHSMTFDADGHRHGLEFLAEGQQVVISGQHKDGGLQSCNLVDWRLEGLPVITEADVEELFVAFKAAGEACGYQVDVKPTSNRISKHSRVHDPIIRTVLERKDDWLPDVLGRDVAGDLPLRITSHDLDRELEEDLEIYVDGIYDHGTRRSHDPITLICEFGETGDNGVIGFGGSPEYEPGDGEVYVVKDNVFDTVRRPTAWQAATWLCRRLGGEAFPEYIGPPDWPHVSGAVAKALGTSLQDLALARVSEFVDWSMFDPQPEAWGEDEIKKSSSLVTALRIADPTRYERLTEGWAQRPAEAVPVAVVEEAVRQGHAEHVERERKAHSAATVGILVVSSKINPSTIPIRKYVIEPRLLLGDVTQIVGEPAVSKSSLALLDAVRITSGRDDIRVASERLHRSGPVIVYNAEDRLDDMQRRLTAIQAHFGVHDTPDPIVLWSGVDGPTLTIMRRSADKNGVLERSPGADFLESMIIRHQPVLVCLDPQISLMAGSQENSNDDINALYQELANIAAKHLTSVQVIHHTSKATRDNAGDMGAGRGGFAAAGKARAVYTLVNVTGKAEDEKQFAVSAGDSLVRLDSAKMNHAAKPRSATIFRRRSVAVGNGQGLPPATAAALFEHSPRQMLEATGDYAPVLEPVSLDELRRPAQAVEVDIEIARTIAVAVDLVMGDLEECQLPEILETVGARLRSQGVTSAASAPKLRGLITNALLGGGVVIQRSGQSVRLKAAKNIAVRAAPWTITRTIEEAGGA